MNFCILYGKIISNMEFEFLYNSKKHVSVLTFKLLPEQQMEGNEKCKDFIIVKAYDELADMIYQKVKQFDYIYIEGKLTSKFVEASFFTV